MGGVACQDFRGCGDVGVGRGARGPGWAGCLKCLVVFPKDLFMQALLFGLAEGTLRSGPSCSSSF